MKTMLFVYILWLISVYLSIRKLIIIIYAWKPIHCMRRDEF